MPSDNNFLAEFPPELYYRIFEFLPLKQLPSLRIINKKWNKITGEKFFQGKTGENERTYKQQFLKLEYPALKLLLLNDVIGFELAIGLNRHLNALKYIPELTPKVLTENLNNYYPKEILLKVLMTCTEITKIVKWESKTPTWGVIKKESGWRAIVKTNNGFIAIISGFISIREVKQLHSKILEILFSEKGMSVFLIKRWITPTQLIQLVKENNLKEYEIHYLQRDLDILLSFELEQEKISFKGKSLKSTPWEILRLFFGNMESIKRLLTLGSSALEKNLITVSDAAQLSHNEIFETLFSKKGMQVLIQKLITPSQLIQFLPEILENNSSFTEITALIEKRKFQIYENLQFLLSFDLEPHKIGCEDKFIEIKPNDALRLFFGKMDRLKILITKGDLALRQKTISIPEATQLDSDILEILFSEKGIEVLTQKLITVEQLVESIDRIGLSQIRHDFKYLLSFDLSHKQVSYGDASLKITPFEALTLFSGKMSNLKALLTKNGKIALEKKLITIEEALQLSSGVLDTLFSKKGIQALKQKLLKPSQLIQFINTINLENFKKDHSSSPMDQLENDLFRLLSFILGEETITYACHTLKLKPMEALTLFFANMRSLESLFTMGTIALKEGLITILEAAKLSSEILEILFSEKGVRILTKKLFPVSQVIAHKKDQGFLALLNDLVSNVFSVKLLESKLISFEAMATCLPGIRAILFTETGIAAFENNLLNCKLLMQFSNDLSKLTTYLSNGFLGLVEKLFSKEELHTIMQSISNTDNFVQLMLHPKGLMALREKLIDLKNLSLIDVNYELTDNILETRKQNLEKSKLKIERENKEKTKEQSLQEFEDELIYDDIEEELSETDEEGCNGNDSEDESIESTFTLK